MRCGRFIGFFVGANGYCWRYFRAREGEGDRYRAGYERWEWKGKVGGEKDEEGLGGGSEVEVECCDAKSWPITDMSYWAVGKLLRPIFNDIYVFPTAIASTSNSSSGNASAAT